MVKEGYKETEFGIIPEDWSFSLLEPTVGKVKSGKRLPKGYLVTQNVTAHPYIRVMDMKMGMLDTTNIMYVPDDAFPSISQYCIYKNDLYISVAGTLGLVGRIPPCLDGANLTENANRITDITCDINYLLYWLMGAEIQKLISNSQTLGAQPKLALYQIRNFPIPLSPYKKEQRLIAEALSDMDNLISSLEKLIEKKKTIKQGAMQELLIGKKRLSGYNCKWTKMNLAKKSKIKARIGWQGLTTAEYLDSGYSYLVTGTDFKNGFIDWDGCHYVEKTRFDQDKNIQIQNDDILITKDGSLGKVAYVSGLSKPATLNSGVFVIRPIQNAYDTRFVYYVLSSFVFKDFLEQLSAGSTIIHLYQKDMNKFDFYIPDDIKEQKAIADILFDMDAEITALEQKLVKSQKLKQGMMQQLLTGKIRLVSNDDTVVEKPEVDSFKVSPKGHNHQFDDAVVIAGIVDKFYSDKYPLGRKKVQKLLYLFRRHQEADTSAFKKKAAGPYSDEVRYKGGEPIAQNKKYISISRNSKGALFNKGINIADALNYIEKWGLNDDFDWLLSNFNFTKTDRLELLATIDMAMCDLEDLGIAVSVDNIKNLIKSHKEWKAKLSKKFFSNTDIDWAIKECRRLFNKKGDE